MKRARGAGVLGRPEGVPGWFLDDGGDGEDGDDDDDDGVGRGVPSSARCSGPVSTSNVLYFLGPNEGSQCVVRSGEGAEVVDESPSSRRIGCMSSRI